MSLIANLLDVVRDTKHIVDAPADNGKRWQPLLRSYLGVRRMKREHVDGIVRIFDYRVRYLNAAPILQLFREIFVERHYDVPLDTASPSIIDCGSNIGMSILFFKHRYPAARIMGFEPSPLAFSVLTRNVKENGLRDVVLHQRAVSDKPGEIDFFVKPGEPGALTMGLVQRSGDEIIKVQSDRLSTYIEAEFDLLKLDIEGAEVGVFSELAESGKLRCARHIVCEYHHHMRKGVDRLSIVLRLLEEAGFGYQLNGYTHYSVPHSEYQDILIYAYRKDAQP